jgi:RNA polymerase sigma factor (TIGR02999 family)
MSSEPNDVTALLERIRQGSAEARDELFALLYDRFKQRAHQRLQRERPGHSLGTTGLTHEVWERLHQNDEFAKAADRNQLFRAFARAMEQVLIDHARRRNAQKRGGGWRREELDDLVDDVRRTSQVDDVLDLHEALEALDAVYPVPAEVLRMHYFGGYTLQEIAEVLNVSPSTVRRAFQYGWGFLRDSLGPEGAS